MARSISPGGYSNYDDDAMFQNAAFTHDISEQMRVPKRIRATGDYYDDQDLLPNGNGEINSWNYHNKIDMTVPDRIVVLGQDQHLGKYGFPGCAYPGVARPNQLTQQIPTHTGGIFFAVASMRKRHSPRFTVSNY